MRETLPSIDPFRASQALASALGTPVDHERRWHRPLVASDVLPPALYGLVRSHYLPQVRRVLAARRVWLGPHVSVQFENRVTAVYHLHESLRADGCWSPRDVARALAEHTLLVPRPGTLTATVMVHGGPDAASLCRRLARGASNTLSLRIGNQSAGAHALDRADPRYPVHYLGFELSAANRTALSRLRVGAQLVLSSDCGSATASAVSLPAPVRRALLDDLGVQAAS